MASVITVTKVQVIVPLCHPHVNFDGLVLARIILLPFILKSSSDLHEHFSSRPQSTSYDILVYEL